MLKIQIYFIENLDFFSSNFEFFANLNVLNIFENVDVDCYNDDDDSDDDDNDIDDDNDNNLQQSSVIFRLVENCFCPQ